MPKMKSNFIPVVDGVRTLRTGIETYQCQYYCHVCGHRGKRFLDEKAQFTKCHKCLALLTVYPSTENDGHDDKFNYFLAY